MEGEGIRGKIVKWLYFCVIWGVWGLMREGWNLGVIDIGSGKL